MTPSEQSNILTHARRDVLVALAQATYPGLCSSSTWVGNDGAGKPLVFVSTRVVNWLVGKGWAEKGWAEPSGFRPNRYGRHVRLTPDGHRVAEGLWSAQYGRGRE